MDRKGRARDGEAAVQNVGSAGERWISASSLSLCVTTTTTTHTPRGVRACVCDRAGAFITGASKAAV